MLTILAYGLSVAWLTIKVIVIGHLIKFILYDSATGMINKPPWRTGIFIFNQNAEKEGAFMAILEVMIDMMKFIGIAIIFFAITLTLSDLFTNGLQPVTTATAKIFLYSIGLTICLWIIFAGIAYRQKNTY
ncbi:MAG: hypothetical protein WC819_01530 [Parcubacteria group bacterium]|jgi:hypothetical protein